MPFFMANNGSIGFFDSGVGGLTIWNELVKLLPNENTLYIADSINAPYGVKTMAEVQSLSFINTQRLIDLGAKIIVVACNTATTQAISNLRNHFDIPFIGIEPAIKPAALKSVSKVIGVLATNGTLESELFKKTKSIYSNDVKVISQVGEGLVDAIEKGKLDSVELEQILSQHLEELTKYPIDYLVLGCTHYPLLRPMIKQIIGDNISIVDTGLAVATQTKHVLSKRELLTSSNHLGTHTVYATSDALIIKSIVNKMRKGMEGSVIYSSLYQSE
jgi:glutamate racemase